MPSPDPKKSFLMEGGADCQKIRVIHSNKLQEQKSYTYEKKRPDEGNPLKFYLLNFGGSVQPGDPVILKTKISGDGDVLVDGGNPDSEYMGPPGSTVFVASPVEESENELVWPCEFDIVDNLSHGGSTPGSTLRWRTQAPNYRPNYLPDADIEADPLFTSLYNDWLNQRTNDWFSSNQSYPPPPEEYEIANAKQRIFAELRELFSVQWNDWNYSVSVSEKSRYGSYWSGGRDNSGYPVWIDYSYIWIPELSAGLFKPDGTAITGEGIDPVTLLAYEFVSEPSLDIADIDDWTEVLRINFMGTPAPLTIECDDSNCPNHCLEIIRPEDKAWKCICSSDDLEPTPIAETPNRIDRKRPPGAPDPPPKNLGQRKAKARDYKRKLQPKFDKAKAKYQKAGDTGEAAHKQHKEKDAIAKDPIRPQSERDAAAAAAAQALLDRDDAIAEAKKAAEEMLEAKSGLDDLDDFLEDDPDDESGISVGTALPPKPGWRPPLVMGGTGWNNTPTYINNNAEKSTTQDLGPRGGIQAAQIQNPTTSGGGGFQDSQSQDPTAVGGGGFVAGEWNATPTVIIETPEEIISQIISEE
jgi:hypothetical protein